MGLSDITEVKDGYRVEVKSNETSISQDEKFCREQLEYVKNNSGSIKPEEIEKIAEEAYSQRGSASQRMMLNVIWSIVKRANQNTEDNNGT